jgi:peptidoglycan-associated lipoprotein
MITARSIGPWALAILVPFFGLADIGCSHQQKAPTAHPSQPMAAQAPLRWGAPKPAQRQAAASGSEDKAEPVVFFDFDSYTLRQEAHPVLQKVASKLRDQSTEKLRIEGNCDDLGTIEYNLALGDERARAAKTYLVHLGVPDSHIATISYGSERPKYPGHDDDARAKNRRDDLVVR